MAPEDPPVQSQWPGTEVLVGFGFRVPQCGGSLLLRILFDARFREGVVLGFRDWTQKIVECAGSGN